MFEHAKTAVEAANRIVIIQAENPDGDSLGSALALEEVLGDLGKHVVLFCAIDIPKYLHYVQGWDRVTSDFPKDFDLSIIVDTASSTLLEKALIPVNRAQIEKKPSIVIDHHDTEGTIPFEHISILDSKAASTGELIFALAKENSWKVNPQAAENLAISILADTLGLVTASTTANSVRTVAELIEHGASLTTIDTRRREYMKKPAEILEYKGQLLQRIEYYLDGALALVHIPWEDIAKYSDRYNPSILVLDEMRLVTGVRLAIAIKTYPDGKLTGKLRANPDSGVAEQVAGFFGGGGHAYSAGFRTYTEDYDGLKTELIGAVHKILCEYDKTTTTTEPC